MAQGLREKSKASKRRGILQAAERLFAERSFHDVLLDDVAAAAHVAKGTLYLYFSSKEQLYLSLLQESFEPLARDLKDNVHGKPSAWDALESIVRGLLEFGDQHPAIREMLRITTVESRERILRDSIHQVVSLIERVLQQGIDAGEFTAADPRVTAQLILGMIGKMNSLLSDRTFHTPLQEVIRQVLNMVARGLSVRPTTAGSTNAPGRSAVREGDSHE